MTTDREPQASQAAQEWWEDSGLPWLYRRRIVALHADLARVTAERDALRTALKNEAEQLRGIAAAVRGAPGEALWRMAKRHENRAALDAAPQERA